MIALVGGEMSAEAVDALGKQRDLYLRGTGVPLIAPVALFKDKPEGRAPDCTDQV